MLFDTIEYVPGADHYYDISGSTLSAPANGDVIMRFEAVRGFKIPANFNGTYVSVPSTPPSGGDAVLQLKVNGSNVSGATLTLAQTTGSLTKGTFSEVTVQADQLVELVCTTANSVNGIAWTIKTLA